MIKIYTFFILISMAFACQSNSAETRTQPVKPAETKTASPTPSPAPMTPKNGNYNGRGVVTKINLEIVSVELDHEEIKDLMPKMIMEFYVTKKEELEKLKVGDKAVFVVEYKDGQEKIVSIKKAE